jgi:hypothetical protein
VACERVCGAKGLLCEIQGITGMPSCCIVLVAKQQQQGRLVVQLSKLRAAGWAGMQEA